LELEHLVLVFCDLGLRRGHLSFTRVNQRFSHISSLKVLGPPLLCFDLFKW
jgi:hypothetical protein